MDRYNKNYWICVIINNQHVKLTVLFAAAPDDAHYSMVETLHHSHTLLHHHNIYSYMHAISSYITIATC